GSESTALGAGPIHLLKPLEPRVASRPTPTDSTHAQPSRVEQTHPGLAGRVPSRNVARRCCFLEPTVALRPRKAIPWLNDLDLLGILPVAGSAQGTNEVPVVQGSSGPAFGRKPKAGPLMS